MAAEFPEIDFHSYHEQELPRLLREGRGVLAATAANRLGPFAFRVTGGSGGDGESYTYRVGSGGVEVVAGDAEADTVIEIGSDAWQGLANDLESAPGLLYAGRVKCLRGKAMKLVAWEPSLRAMYTGRPPFDPFDIQPEDRHGAPLDCEQSFAPDDDPADMAHFLRTAGYLLVRDVFRADEVDVFLREARELRGEAVAQLEGQATRSSSSSGTW